MVNRHIVYTTGEFYPGICAESMVYCKGKELYQKIITADVVYNSRILMSQIILLAEGFNEGSMSKLQITISNLSSCIGYKNIVVKTRSLAKYCV